MKPYQERVVSEKAELDYKRAKLAAFVGTDAHGELPKAEKERLRYQLDAMNEYSIILGERIEAFAEA